MKPLSASSVYAYTLVQYACRHTEVGCPPEDGRLHVRFPGDLEDFAIEAPTLIRLICLKLKCCLGLPMAAVLAIILFPLTRTATDGDSDACSYIGGSRMIF